ncbi:MAG: patatin-like phospholipase family protein [Bacteroidia bacterium]|nr:patatin-like phospholipase family protein [Bacteroidia bacterium]MCZ2248609.1 patatin-like phospholipase family protein [Bacteroidia bacterium]
MNKSRKKISLALQGGGSHGAFTWGIIERLLEEDILDIRGICGTSAGAMNAAITSYGLHKGGNQGAIDLLERFWRRVANSAYFSPMQPNWLDSSLYPGSMNYPFGFNLFNLMTQVLSPYQFNPLDINPLKDIIEDLIDFEELQQSNTKVFACATNVKTCKPKIFKGKEITADALMASACLPLLYKAVEINGQFYWDGGYMGNPSIYPLIDDTDSNDILLVKVNSVVINEVPQTVSEIQDRINDISFNSSLMAEMRMVYFKEKILKLGYDLRGRLRKIYFHSISADQVLDEYNLASKFNASWSFLNTLRKKGRTSAEKWINEQYHHVGHNSSIDIRKVFV